MWQYNAAAGYGYPYAATSADPSVPAAANAYAYPAAVGYPPAAASVLSAYPVDASVHPVVSAVGGAVSADSNEYNDYEADGQRYIEEEEPAIGAGKRLEMVCDAKYNMNEVLVHNITSAEYFRQLYNLKTYHEVIDEALKKATHLEPFSAGQQRLPSTAFVLLYKFFTLKLTIKQLNGLLGHRSGIARGLGFLYLRYVCDPKKLWDWFEPYLDDETPIPASVDRSNQMTAGKFARMLLTEHTYFGTMFKRIPIPILREFQIKLAEHAIQKQKKAENEKIRPKLKVGTKCLALYAEDGQYYEAIVDEFLPNGKILITYTQYSNQEEAEIGNLKLIEKGRSRSRSRDRSKERARKRSRSRSRSKGRGRGRSRSASPRRDRDSRRDRDRRSRSRSRDRRDRGRDTRDSRDSRDRDRDRRSRSRSRDRSRSSSKEGVSRDELLKQILRQEQDKAAASGKDYARRPASYKQALSLKLTTGTARARSKSPPASSSSRDRRRDRERDREPSPPRRKEVSAEQKEKMQRLKAIYGDASDKAAAGGSSDYAPSAASGPKAKLVDTTDVIRLGQ